MAVPCHGHCADATTVERMFHCNILVSARPFLVGQERGEGVFLYDTEGRRYLDFAAGIAVCGLGYGNKELQDAMKRQIDLLMHTSNLYYNTACGSNIAFFHKFSRLFHRKLRDQSARILRIFVHARGRESRDGASVCQRASCDG